MKKKLLIIVVAIFVFMITPNVEAKEVSLDELFNGIRFPVNDTPTWDFELDPGDVLTFDKSNISSHTQYTFHDKVSVYIDNKQYNTNQQFTCDSEARENCKYTVLSYEGITNEKPPRGKNVKIAGTIVYWTSSLQFDINLYYQYIDDVQKGVVYNNLFDATNDNPTAYYEGETDILLSDPVRKGYKFLGWYTSPDFDENTRVTMITKDEPDELVLYAKWEKEEENIFTNPNTSSMIYIVIGIGIIVILGTVIVIVYKKNNNKVS